MRELMDDGRTPSPSPYFDEQRYEPDATAPRRARAFVGGVLKTLHRDEELRREADLLTSEVVADAVRHVPSYISVRVEFDRPVFRVEVSNDPGLVVVSPGAGTFERRTARRLINALARRWGSDSGRERTTTWFELTVP